MKIAIFGGAFNPVHNGHIYIAEKVQKHFGFDKLFFVPSNISVHKNNYSLVSQTHRLKMLELALEDTEFEVLPIEIERGGRSFTCDTVDQLYENYDITGGVHIIIGDDLLPTLHKWKNFEQLSLLTEFIVMYRDKKVYERTDILYTRLKNDYFNVSSTQIRNSVLIDEDISDLINPKVYQYIKEHNLYK